MNNREQWLATVQQAFRERVTRHYAHPPATWRVEKRAERDWRIVNGAGEHVGYVWNFPTRKAALADIDPNNAYSQSVRMWNNDSAWYEGRADSRYRKLEPWEQTIVDDVLGTVRVGDRVRLGDDVYTVCNVDQGRITAYDGDETISGRRELFEVVR